MTGKVTFVGAGSGDPRLLTLRAVEVLERADFVLFDPAVHPDILAHVRGAARRRPITAQLTPERVGQLLAAEVRDGRSAVRLTWGDPLLFGVADVEAAAVARHDVPLEIVPGVHPLVSVGAFAGVPLTRSTDASPSVAAVSVTRGLEALHDWEKLATATDTLAILVDAESVAETARSLVFHGRPTSEPAMLIEGLSLPTQRLYETTLGELPLLAPPKASRVVLVVGERSTPMPELAWFERLPLFGKRVLVTRARAQAKGTASLLRERGADPVVVPTIEIDAPVDPRPMAEAVSALGRYGWVVFTSANGVERLWAEVRRQGKDARAFASAKIAVIGPGTAAALASYGLAPDRVAKVYKGEGLADDLVAAIGDGGPRVLVARAEVARDVVPDALRAAGCEVDVVSAYTTRAPPKPLLEALAALLEGHEIDVVTFTSSSTVEHFCDALEGRAPALLGQTCVASIGPVTTETARRRGLRVDVTASEHTVDGLVAAVEGYFVLTSTGTRAIARI